VREGLLYELLDDEERPQDPLIAAARELNLLRSRAPPWRGADRLDRPVHAGRRASRGDAGGARLRHAACLLADIGWRAHPDYRGEQS
jgi:exopolyphosphatase/guanosine-5'-triphosphate,3'-diphosphate pyrophosphatase